jgi:predicted RNA polymerase sigma factor
MTDHLRSELARRRREDAVASQLWAEWAFVPPPDAEIGVASDDTLVLLFMCCHPALTPAVGHRAHASRGGRPDHGGDRQRLPRPRGHHGAADQPRQARIKSSKTPFSMPAGAERAARLSAVLHVLYLIFNEGYASSSGPELQRTDLSNEAIRLARAVHALLPDDGEVAGLLALMLLTDARRAARTGPHGELIPLDEQDRTLWDPALIAEGVALVSDALSRGSVGSYQLQAAIAAVHDEAARAADTDWPQILALYGLLERMSDNPMVSLNRAIAAAMVRGPEVGLEMLKALDGDARIGGHYRLDAVRAHLHERAGDPERAIAHYRAAAERTASTPERDYLTLKAARLAAGRREEASARDE